MAIPNQTITHHHVGEIKEEFAAGIRAEDFPHIANLLINLYSDPIQAVIREYATNALDAHIAAGNPDPILITLPTNARPEFVVQDFGIGLTIDDLRDVYSMYGRSLKRDSNDFVGQLGLGCKSGLTYADAFTITAIKDGVKCVAISTKDSRGVGTIQVKDTVGTNEPNGVRIAIPVKTRDISDFRYTATELFQFWEPGTVLVDGKAPEVPEWRKQGLALDDHTWVIPTDAGLYSSYVIMGNVAYEVPDAQFGPSHQRQTRRFVAVLNMGDVDFVPSREAVHNTPWTTETLSDLHDFIGTHFSRVLNERLAQCPTRWDETQLKVLWKGSQMQVRASQHMPIWEYQPHAYGRKARAHTAYRFAALTRTTTVVVTGFPNKSLSPLHRERLTELVPDCKHFIVVPHTSDASGFGGRENVYTWDEVIGATDDPSTAKGGRTARTKRAETQYLTVNGPSYTASELAALGTKVLFLYPQEGASAGTLDCTIVKLYSSNQIDRLRRFIPGIKHYTDELRTRREAVEAAITDYDRQLIAARQLHKTFTRLPAGQIIDTELAEAIRMADLPDTPTIAAARSMGVAVQVGTTTITRKFAKRYPLLDPDQHYYRTSTPVEDAILYINSKYAGLAAEKLSKSLDYNLNETLDAAAS
jgi:hypothetical protein